MASTPAIHNPFIPMARAAANAHQLFEHIICGICERESSWNPTAIRYEPLFFAKYVAKQFTNNQISATEAYARAFSWGLMQTMGQSVREIGYGGDLPALCYAANGLDWGCRLFLVKLRYAEGNYENALKLWNGGANPDYATQVLEMSEKYRIQ